MADESLRRRDPAPDGSAPPTLDAIAAAPERARELPREQIVQFQLRALAVAMACGVVLLGEPPMEADAGDVTLTTDAAAALLGISTSTLRHGASTTYKGLRIENGTRKLGWSRRRLERFMKRR